MYELIDIDAIPSENELLSVSPSTTRTEIWNQNKINICIEHIVMFASLPNAPLQDFWKQQHNLIFLNHFQMV